MIDPNLITKIEETLNQALNSEEKYASWRGKVNEADEFQWKIIADCRHGNSEDDYLIRVVKR
jgi:hypothetical protein